MNIKGFNYTTQQPETRSREEWVSMLAQASSTRSWKGETFAHDSRGVMLFEVYASILTSPTEEPDWLA